jgi:hypothetical protein
MIGSITSDVAAGQSHAASSEIQDGQGRLQQHSP